MSGRHTDAFTIAKTRLALRAVARKNCMPGPAADFFEPSYAGNGKKNRRKLFLGLQHPHDGAAGLRFLSSQTDTSLHCETKDTGLVHRAVCLFTLPVFTGSHCAYARGMARLS